MCIQIIMHKWGILPFVAIYALLKQIFWHFPSMKFISFRFSNITYSGMLPNHLQIFALVHQAAPKCCNLCLNVILPLKKLDSSIHFLIHWLKLGFYIHQEITSDIDVFTFSSLLRLIQSFDMLKVSEIQPSVSKPLRKVFISGGGIKSFKPGPTYANM